MCNDHSAIKIVVNHLHYDQIKYIETDQHFIRQMINQINKTSFCWKK